MSDAIHKYPLQVTDEQMVSLPAGCRLLCVQVQHGCPCVWAWVDPQEERRVNVRFVTIGTGNPIPANIPVRYLGTYQLHDGALVFHLFCDFE